MDGLGGILLTGGASSRMGRDKARIEVGGTPLAERTADLLASVADHLIEVGPATSGLPSVLESPRGSGPLAAVVAGHQALLDRGLGASSACLVLACDLPLLDRATLEVLATWPGDSSVLPVIDSIAQPLCARWSAADLRAARAALESGERSLRTLPDREHSVLLDEAVLPGPALRDVDSPEDLKALGLGGPPR